MPRRRKPRGEAARDARRQRALEAAGVGPKTAAVSPKPQALSGDEQDLLHRAIARAIACGKPVFPSCRRAFMDATGRELPRSTYVYYATSPKREAERQRYLAEALESPDVLACTEIGYLAQAARRVLEAALKPRIADVKIVTAQDGSQADAWRTRPQVIERQDLKAALGAIDRLQRIAELRQGLPHTGGGAKTPRGARGQRVDDQAEPDDGLPVMDPRAAAALDAEAGQPFRTPDVLGSTETLEQHRERIRRWEEEGLAPPGAPPRPTRRVHDDGTVELLSGNGGGTVMQTHRRVADEPDLGEAVLSAQAPPRAS